MKRERKTGIIAQTYMLIIAGIILSGALIYYTQYRIAVRSVWEDTRDNVSQTVADVVDSLEEYPAYTWMFTYWAEHADEMDVEYEAEFDGNSMTEQKSIDLLSRYPGYELKYLDEGQIGAMTPEDRKLYAEIMYAWLLRRIDGIKRTFGCSYLYIVITDTDDGENPYERYLFLISGADKDQVRGTEYDQAYVLGVDTEVRAEETKTAMRDAVIGKLEAEDDELVITGEKIDRNSTKYLDYYAALEVKGDKAVLAGVTFYLGDMLDEVRLETLMHTLLAMAYLSALLGILMLFIFAFMLRPLKRVLEEIRTYTGTKDSAKAEEHLTKYLSQPLAYAVRHNEIGQLAEDFIDMTKEIDTYTGEIQRETAARERMEYELETAAKIQASMLPDPCPEFPDHPEIVLSARMLPAKQVGGDFYDYFFLEDGHLVMVIADVSDKGVPAALFMARAKALIRSAAAAGKQPGEILAQVNEQLCENNEKGYFVTVWIAIIDPATGEGTAANAGHEHPVLCRAGGRYELVLYKHDLAVGLMEGMPYRQHTFKLGPGDRLFVYTDGVPEAVDHDKNQFGAERMLETLNADPGAEPKEVLELMETAIETFAAGEERFDDTTMISLWYRGSQSGKEQRQS